MKYLERKNKRNQIGKVLLMGCLSIALLFSPVCEAKASNTSIGDTIRVGFYESPFNQTDSYGRYSGYAYDYQQEIATYTGWKYEYVNGTWPELMEMLKDGEIDLMSNVSYNDERSQIYDFSEMSMGTEEFYIFVYGETARIDSSNYMRTIDGAKIGVKVESMEEKLLKAWCEEKGLNPVVESFESDEKMVYKLKNGELDAIADGESLKDGGICNPIIPIGTSEFYFVTNKKHPEYKEALDDAMEKIQKRSRYFQNELYRKYMAPNGNSYLSDEECQWISEHGAIRIGFRDNYLAFCGTDGKSGQLIGALATYVDLASISFKNIELQFEPVAYKSTTDALEAMERGEVDCVFPVHMSKYDAEQQNLLLTDMLMGSDMYAVVREKEVTQFSAEKDNIVAINVGNPNYLNFVRNHFPNWKILDCEDTRSCMEAVADGRADCVLISNFRLGNVESMMEEYRLFSTTTGHIMDLGIATRRDTPYLYSILNRTINLIPDANINAALTSTEYITRNVSWKELIHENLAGVFTTALVIVMLMLAILVKSMISERHAQSLNRELVRSQADLRQALDEARQASEAKTYFLNNMSHDIRTPMNAILGYAELMEKEIDNPGKIANYLGKIKTSGVFLLSLINNVLEMAKIESGKFELSESVSNLTKGFDEIISVFAAEMEEKDIALHCDCQVEHEWIYMDRTKVREILLNLISNAVKYTNHGGEIWFRVREESCSKKNYAKYMIQVCDTGIGISEEHLPKLFDSFFREKNTTESRVAGTGLGLAIVKELVDFLGGSIEVQSKKGEGSTFTLHLEFAIAEQEKEEALVSEQEKEQEKEHGMENSAEQFKGIGRGRRILLAEDNELNAEIAIAILEDNGFLVDRAFDGIFCVEMLNKATKGYYSCILMDIQMPNMDGYKATSAIRNIPFAGKRDIPIIAMTANAFDEDRKKAFAVGMNGFVSKPINVKELLDTIEEIVQ